MHKFYLSPFRLYKFQISDDQDGNRDYGSSEVVGLGNLINMIPNNPKNTKGYTAFASNVSIITYHKIMMRSLALDAIFKFYSRYRCMVALEGDNINIILNIDSMSDKKLLNRYIDLVYDYTVEKTRSFH